MKSELLKQKQFSKIVDMILGFILVDLDDIHLWVV